MFSYFKLPVVVLHGVGIIHKIRMAVRAVAKRAFYRPLHISAAAAFALVRSQCNDALTRDRQLRCDLVIIRNNRQGARGSPRAYCRALFVQTVIAFRVSSAL